MKKILSIIFVFSILFLPMMPEVEAATYYKSINTAGKKVRGYMKKRQTKFKIYLNKRSLANTVKKGNSTGYKMIDVAYKHTGVGTEGDYISGNVLSYQFSWVRKGNKTVYTYKVKYRTTKAQETKVTNRVKSIISSLKLGGKSTLEKIKSIYHYITSNVSYDYSYEKNTAYDALFNKKTVCHGYALLFYRMACYAGLKCRYVSGNANGSHAWNIVKLGNKYYNVDSTWDAGKDIYEYFMKSDKDNTYHSKYKQYKTSAFKKAYPMSTTSYQFINNKLPVPTVTRNESDEEGLYLEWNNNSYVDGYIYTYANNSAMKNSKWGYYDWNTAYFSTDTFGNPLYVRLYSYKVDRGVLYKSQGTKIYKYAY